MSSYCKADWENSSKALSCPGTKDDSNGCVLKLNAPSSFGALLAGTFYQAGIRLIETGPIQNAEKKRSAAEWENEWALIEADLVDSIPGEDLQNMKVLDKQLDQLAICPTMEV